MKLKSKKYMETTLEIGTHKHLHSFYLFVGIIVFGIIVLQPLSMVLIMIMQTLAQQ